MKQHTPTPLEAKHRILARFDGEDEGQWLIAIDRREPGAINGEAVAWAASQEEADLIVRACNAHDALVADLRQAIFYMEELTNTKPHFIKHAKQTLKLAEGK